MNDLRCPLREAAEISGRQPALVREGLSLSYAEYDALVAMTAARMRAADFRKGERVGLFLQNDWMYPVLLMALLRLGAVACPLNIRWPRQQLRSALRSIGCGKMIAHTKGTQREKRLWGMRVFPPDGFFVAEPLPVPAESCGRFALDQPATIVFTTGSSGHTKAVLHSYGNHYYSAKASNANLRLRSGDRWLLALPLYHVSGLSILFRCIMGGAAVVMTDERTTLAQALRDYEITHLSVVDTQLRRLLDADIDAAAIGRLRGVLVGGSAIPPTLVREARRRGLPLFTTYGLTEMASQVTTTSAATPPAEQTTSGKPLPYCQVRIGPDHEIQVKGKSLFLGYVEGNETTRPVSEDGWFATGDVGDIDASGYLSVRGRRDNMFVSGGENIHPEEIERALRATRGIQDAVVVPVPHAEYGYRPVAFLKARRGDLPRKEELVARLEAALPRYKIPDAFYAWPGQEQVNGTIKVNRPFFRALARDMCQDVRPE